MKNLEYLFDIVFLLFRRKFVLFGFEMSFFDIFIWLFVAGLIFWFLREVFDG